MVNSQTDLTPITPEERARRQAAVDFARTSVRLEGFILDPDIEALYARYVDGGLTDGELTVAIQEAVEAA